MHLNATLIVQIFVFLALWWFTAKYVWPPITQVLSDRARKIAEGLAASERSKTEWQELQQRIEKEMEIARLKASDLRASAERQAESLLAATRSQADQILSVARNDAEKEAKIVVSRLTGEIVASFGEMVLQAAERVLQKEINPNNHSSILLEGAEALKSRLSASGHE